MHANKRKFYSAAPLTVLNTLGLGFVETVYENPLAHAVRKAGLSVVRQEAPAIPA